MVDVVPPCSPKTASAATPLLVAHRSPLVAGCLETALLGQRCAIVVLSRTANFSEVEFAQRWLLERTLLLYWSGAQAGQSDFFSAFWLAKSQIFRPPRLLGCWCPALHFALDSNFSSLLQLCPSLPHKIPITCCDS